MFGVFGYYQLTPLAAAAIVLLSLIVAVHGLKPFGDTVGYQVLLSAVWIPFGIIWFITEGSVLPLLLAAVSILGALFYARRATKHGVWTPAN